MLGAAACAYKAITPRRYFAKSGRYDETMQEWVIEYELVDRKLNAKDIVRRRANFRNARWNRDAVDRNVLVFAVSRTVPRNQRSELLRCASGRFKVPTAAVKSFSTDLQQSISRILGKDVSGFRQLNVDLYWQGQIAHRRHQDRDKLLGIPFRCWRIQYHSHACKHRGSS